MRISAQLDRLDRMVGDLLEQTRIEAGNLELRLEETDLRILVTDVVELHRPSSQQHQLEITVPDVPVPVRGDPTRLTQVLTNLLSNAIKYSPRGGRVWVRLEHSQEEILLSVIVRAHGGNIEVVSQEGTGSTFRVRLPPQPPPA